MKKFLPLSLIAVALVSCQKEGPGGDTSITAFPEHHGNAINNGTVYIKYGAKELPGTNPSDFDASTPVIIEKGYAPHGHFSGLKKGDYYLFHVGYDSAISEPVSGGLPVKIKEPGEVIIKLPTTEK